jgi:hypothetical protein
MKNFFKGIFSAIAGFFKSSAGKKLRDASIKVLRQAGGRVADEVYTIAEEEVKKVQEDGGPNKYVRAFEAIRGRIPGWKEVKNSLINLAIEQAVAVADKEYAFTVRGKF